MPLYYSTGLLLSQSPSARCHQRLEARGSSICSMILLQVHVVTHTCFAVLAFIVSLPRLNAAVLSSRPQPSVSAFVLSCRTEAASSPPVLLSYRLPECVCIQMRDQDVLPEGLSFKDICYHAAEPHDGSEFTADILKASNVAQRSSPQKGFGLISLSCHHLHLSRSLPQRWPFSGTQFDEHEAPMFDTIVLKSWGL